jgi:hypothetical protein
MSNPRIIIVGACTRTSARITVVAEEPARTAYLAYSDGAGERRVSLPLVEAAPFRRGTFELEGLTPGATVRYGVVCVAEGAPVPSTAELLSEERRRSVRLLPAEEQRPLRIALVSCNGIEEALEQGRFDLWKRLKAQIDEGRVDLIVHTGDQIYADGIYRKHEKLMGTPSLEALTAAYRKEYVRTWENPEVQAVLSSCPSLMTWDDHDIYDGYGSNDEDVLPSARRYFDAAARAFREFQVSGNPPLEARFLQHADGTRVPAEDSFFTCFRSHGVGLILLDGRSRRSYAASSIIGEQQFKVLETVLAAWKAEPGLRRVFVVVGVPVVHAKVAAALSVLESTGFRRDDIDDMRDAWVAPNNREECRRLLMRLFSFMEARPDVELTLLSGDVHVGTLARIQSVLHTRPDGKPAELYQVTSSGIGHPPPEGLMGFLIRHATSPVRHELVDGDRITGALLTISGAPDGRLLMARNFAILKLGPGDGTQWDAKGNLRVEFHAEGFTNPLEQVLLKL